MLQIEVNNEIRSYQEKLFFGMSIRQLGFTALALAVSVGSFFVMKNILNIPIPVISYIVVAMCAPFMALGFIQIHGYPFEKYVMLRLRHYKRSKKPRIYEISLKIDSMYPDDTNDIPYTKCPTNNRRRKNAALQEIKSRADISE